MAKISEEDRQRIVQAHSDWQDRIGDVNIASANRDMAFALYQRECRDACKRAGMPVTMNINFVDGELSFPEPPKTN